MIDISPRSSWGAAAPRSRSKMTGTDKVFVHWLGNAYPDHMTEGQILRSVQRYHMGTKKWSDIAYSFAIGQSGTVYELRGFGIAGGHTRTENHDSYGVCFLIGEGQSPTPEALEACTHLFEEIRKSDDGFDPLVVLGHQHDAEASTACPGPDLTPWAWNYNHARDYQADTPAPAPVPAPEPTPEPPADDANVQFIVKLYADILDREPDDEGLAYWVGQMNSGTPMGAISHEFLTVRLAADKQAMTALREGLAKTVRGGVDSAKAAELAYNLFLDNLLALKS